MLTKTKFSGCAVRFSPFFPNRIAVSSSQNFGIVGYGQQSVFQITPEGLLEVWAYDTGDGVYDCCWSETHENILVSGGGDGRISIWDTKAPPQANPLKIFREHTKEISSVNWNLSRQEVFLSTSWDDTVRLWDLDHPNALSTYVGHLQCVYMAAWNPASSDVFASCSADHTVKVWDARQAMPNLNIEAHNAEVLSVDWCKYNDCVLATGSVDKIIRIWDVRSPARPINELNGHRYAVRKVAFSPHKEHILLTCSYDMTVRLWDVSGGLEDSLLKVWDHHTEFVTGIDFSNHEDGLIASVGWDEHLFVWHMDRRPEE